MTPESSSEPKAKLKRSRAGESYTPPPKRRRTLGSRRRGQDGDASPLASQDTPYHDEPTGSTHSIDMSEPARLVFNDLSDLQLNLPEDFNFDTSLGVEPNLFWSGEGLDFIPLPTIEPTSTIPQEPVDTTSQMERPPSFQLKSILYGTDTSPFSITGENDNRRLIQHYLEVMNGYSKVTDHDSNTNNLFIAAFSKSLFFMPLYYAILSFSASHLTLQDPSVADTARRLEALADENFKQSSQDQKAEVEGLLSALFVRVKRVHVMGESVNSFLRLISSATQIIFSKEGRQVLEAPSDLSRRIVLRLAILDARASCYRLGGGLLVRRLREIPSLSFVFNPDDGESSSMGAFIPLLRADILRMRVGQLDLGIHQQMGTVEVVEVEAVQTDINASIDRWEQRLAGFAEEETMVSSLTTAVYGCYTVISALHSALLYLHSIHPLHSVDIHASVAKILNYQLLIHQDTSRTASPSSILPSSLFLAAIFTEDLIHRDWAIKLLKDGERWGLYVKKTRELVEGACKMREQGDCVNIGLAMESITKQFVI
ncbi:hypothetical protein FSARC_5535 [Fusarium sarcochroum]|uniref:Uncharacterized protein n=1 Tax=Fusarium sarcochroum TaxID=1208366 RepID=A0A8H4TZL6_9HYPO|nr:hypothetical protein FSARC_5535 [Fusarium sarcochroum]